jgi:hypothetical protein
MVAEIYCAMQKVRTVLGPVTPWNTRLHIDAPQLPTVENLDNSLILFAKK